MIRLYRKQLGDILVEAGILSKSQLEEIPVEQRSRDKKFGEMLIKKGYLTEEKLIELLEKQMGIPHVNLYNYNINPEVATSIPAHIAQHHQVIPIEHSGNIITLAVADPFDIVALDDVALCSGCTVKPVIASGNAISHAIDQFFGLKESMEQVRQENEKSKAIDKKEDKTLPRQTPVEKAPIIKVVNSIIQQAVAERASDIHIEPSQNNLRVRFRIDGMLHDFMSPPKNTQALIVSRFKIMANMDITERRLPQDGNIFYKLGYRHIYLRISTLPTIYGEKVMVRVLDKDNIILPLNSLGLNSVNRKRFNRVIESPNGMILVTGPTGCGKTTTLYSILNHLNQPEQNIITVEDPVEYRLEGINQVQVNPRINFTFANALRAILRQDPNIVMIGEIRDRETAKIATRAALTGHLVLSTLHTNDAPGALSRLFDMGVEPYLITSSVLGVIAQRLVRLNCPFCKESYNPSEKEIILFQELAGHPPNITGFQRGRGCRQCNNTGYRGRTAIHEIMLMNPHFHNLILSETSAEIIRRQAVKDGMISLLQDGLGRVEQGHTTVQEVMRVALSAF